MGTITDNNVKTRAGSGSISISHASLPSDSMDVSDIGEVSIEFDVEQQANAADSIFFTPSNFKFSAFDKMVSRASLFEAIDDNLTSTDTIEVEFSFTTDGGWSWTDNTIELTKDNIEYKEERREVTFDCVYNKSITSSLSDIFVALDTYNFRLSNDTNKDCVTCKDYIEYVLGLLSSGTVTHSSNNFSSDPFSGNDTWVLFEDHDGNVYEQEKDPLRILYRLAAVDGSIISVMMGESFFVSRLDTSNNVTLSEDDADVVQINPGLENYRSVSAWFYSILGTDNMSSWSSPYVMYDSLNNDAIKDLNISFYMLELQPAEWDSTNTWFSDDGFVFESDTGADLSNDISEGTFVFEVSADPSLSEDNYFSFSDKRELYLVDGSTASTLSVKTPIRRDVNAEFSTGGNKSIRQIVNTSNRGSMAQNATECYAKAYGADGIRKIKINILDIDSLKPYQTFSLDSSFRSLLRNQTYRPSKLTYNIKTDKISVEAYQIG